MADCLFPWHLFSIHGRSQTFVDYCLDNASFLDKLLKWLFLSATPDHNRPHFQMCVSTFLFLYKALFYKILLCKEVSNSFIFKISQGNLWRILWPLKLELSWRKDWEKVHCSWQWQWKNLEPLTRLGHRV